MQSLFELLATAAECFARVPDCAERQHIVLNAVFINSTWRSRLPRASLLYNLEQARSTRARARGAGGGAAAGCTRILC